MKRIWTIIGVDDVPRSFTWYGWILRDDQCALCGIKGVDSAQAGTRARVFSRRFRADHPLHRMTRQGAGAHRRFTYPRPAAPDNR